MKGFVKEMNFKSGVKRRGSDRWWVRGWWDRDEVITVIVRQGELGGQWTEWGWRNEEGSWFHR